MRMEAPLFHLEVNQAALLPLALVPRCLMCLRARTGRVPVVWPSRGSYLDLGPHGFRHMWNWSIYWVSGLSLSVL